jgi:hypothetical protein
MPEDNCLLFDEYENRPVKKTHPLVAILGAFVALVILGLAVG